MSAFSIGVVSNDERQKVAKAGILDQIDPTALNTPLLSVAVLLCWLGVWPSTPIFIRILLHLLLSSKSTRLSLRTNRVCCWVGH